MKRLTIYVLFAALCFFTGLLAHRLWYVPNAPVEINKPLAVSVCELNRNPQHYDGKLVRVKAILYGGGWGGTPYIADEACGSPNAPSSNKIGVVEDNNQLLPTLPRWATYTSFCGNDTYAAMVNGLAAEVTLVGTFDSSQSRIIARFALQLSPASKRR